MQQTRHGFVEKLKAQIDKWNAQIDKLEAEARSAEADQRIRYENALSDMREKRDMAREQLNQAEKASEDAWEEMRDGFTAAWHEVSSAMDRALSHRR